MKKKTYDSNIFLCRYPFKPKVRSTKKYALITDIVQYSPNVENRAG